MKMSDIPGWFGGSHQVEIIKLLYKYNHPDCVGVEIGSLHGRSSYAISVAIHKGKLYCIDLWNGLSHRTKNTDTIQPETKNTLELFLENTMDRNNIIPIQGSSPSIVKDWNDPIDFIFLDATHTNPNDRENIDFWLPKIKAGGMFLGHDLYEDQRFPDVNLNVKYMENLLNKKVTTIPKTSIWYFELPKN